jgi:hypothetical protein
MYPVTSPNIDMKADNTAVINNMDTNKYKNIKFQDLIIPSTTTSNELITIDKLNSNNLNWNYWISLNRDNLNIPTPNQTVNDATTNIDSLYNYIRPSTTLFYLPFQVTENTASVYFVFICDGFGSVYMDGTLLQTFERIDVEMNIPNNPGNFISKYYWPANSQINQATPLYLEKDVPHVLTVSLSTQNIIKSWRAGFSLFAFTTKGISPDPLTVNIKSPLGTFTQDTLDTKLTNGVNKWFTINC